MLIIITEVTIIGLLVVGIVIYYSSTNVIENPFSVSIIDIKYKDEDITNKIDHEILIELLSETKCRRSSFPSDYLSLKHLDWEINMVSNQKPLHLVLGRYNFCYESSDTGAYRLIDAEILTTELNKLRGT